MTRDGVIRQPIRSLTLGLANRRSACWSSDTEILYFRRISNTARFVKRCRMARLGRVRRLWTTCCGQLYLMETGRLPGAQRRLWTGYRHPLKAGLGRRPRTRKINATRFGVNSANSRIEPVISGNTGPAVCWPGWPPQDGGH